MGKTVIGLCVLLITLTSSFGLSVDERLARLEAEIGELRSELKTEEESSRREISELRSELNKEKEYSRDLNDQLQQRSVSTVAKQAHERGTRQQGKVEVAFFARIGHDVSNLGSNQIIVFDDVVTDVDTTNSVGSYNNATGVFTAPVGGVYVFMVTMHSLTHDSTHFRIYLNNEQITWIYVHGHDISSTDSTSSNVVLLLRRGDTVSVHHAEAGPHGAIGRGHSLFSGFLLYQHDMGGAGAIIG